MLEITWPKLILHVSKLRTSKSKIMCVSHAVSLLKSRDCAWNLISAPGVSNSPQGPWQELCHGGGRGLSKGCFPHQGISYLFELWVEHRIDEKKSRIAAKDQTGGKSWTDPKYMIFFSWIYSLQETNKQVKQVGELPSWARFPLSFAVWEDRGNVWNGSMVGCWKVKIGDSYKEEAVKWTAMVFRNTYWISVIWKLGYPKNL